MVEYQRFQNNESAFEPDAARAISHAFDDVCTSLQIPNSAVKARRIIELGREGERQK